ncbi:MAG: NAD-dependent succinate-semialdehyde dehydrogenase [Alphaproteobacteria bacterium]|nr:NAD-dependent succinate-semialdehyde dehydrogenase [Alphaproteobacteria bacterium]
MKLDNPDLLRHQGYVNGNWVDAENGATLAVTNPADGGDLGTIPDMGADETRSAIEAASAAWGDWRAMTAKARGNILRRWFDLVTANTEDLARIMTTEQGKPLAEARGEIAYGASFIEWFAEEAKRAYGMTIPETVPGQRMVVLKQPIGVVAAITPWNFPHAMITRKTAPALAAGCPVVVKPSELTPFSALALAVLAERAGIPAGVFNVVTGAPEAIGGEMTGNPLVRKLAFTGSTRVGKMLAARAAETVKKVALELGGNAPFMVFADADMEAAVAGAVACKFRNSGQTCVCANRFLVEEGIYDDFAARLTDEVKKLVCGDGMEEGVTQGPLINTQALEKVETHVADAREKGAELLAGGKPHELGGTFYEPTVLGAATSDMQIFHEETFGPVAPLFRFKTEEEAVALANDTAYGLAAYVYTRDLARSWRVSEALEYGIVAVNSGIFSTEAAPFGGMKESGIGREGAKYGMEEFLEIKYVCLGGVDG